jgi:hypothetical protein
MEKAPGFRPELSAFSSTVLILAARVKLIGNGDVLRIVHVRQGQGLTRPV